MTNPPLVFQASSGDSNPNDMKRIVGLVGLYKRQHFEEKETGNKIVNKLAGMIEAAHRSSRRTYELTSRPDAEQAGEAGATSFWTRQHRVGAAGASATSFPI